MNQNQSKLSGERNIPIPKPAYELPESFIRTLESRFTTKKFRKDNDNVRNHVKRLRTACLEIVKN